MKQFNTPQNIFPEVKVWKPIHHMNRVERLAYTLCTAEERQKEETTTKSMLKEQALLPASPAKLAGVIKKKKQLPSWSSKAKPLLSPKF